MLPLAIRRKIAERMRSRSKRYTKNAPAELMDVSNEEVQRVLDKHEMQLMIHGHTHRPYIHEERIVLGAWHEKGNMLVWDENGKRELVDFE